MNLAKLKKLYSTGLRRNLLLIHINGFILTLLFLIKAGIALIIIYIMLMNILGIQSLRSMHMGNVGVALESESYEIN